MTVAVKQVAGEHEPTKESIEGVRRQMRRGYSVQFLSRRLEVAEQVSVHPLMGIERLAMKVEVLARFDRQDEGPELIANTVQDFDKAMMLSFGASGVSREGKARVYMHLVRSRSGQGLEQRLGSKISGGASPPLPVQSVQPAGSR